MPIKGQQTGVSIVYSKEFPPPFRGMSAFCSSRSPTSGPACPRKMPGQLGKEPFFRRNGVVGAVSAGKTPQASTRSRRQATF